MTTSDLAVPTIKFKINIDDYNNLSKMKIMMNYPFDGYLTTFKVSYIAVDAAVTFLKVQYLEKTILTSVSAGSGARQFTGIHTLTFTADFSHTISVIPLLIGLNTTSSGGYDVNWTSTLKSSTEIDYALKVGGNTRVYQIISYFLVFDRTDA